MNACMVHTRIYIYHQGAAALLSTTWFFSYFHRSYHTFNLPPPLFLSQLAIEALLSIDRAMNFLDHVQTFMPTLSTSVLHALRPTHLLRKHEHV